MIGGLRYAPLLLRENMVIDELFLAYYLRLVIVIEKGLRGVLLILLKEIIPNEPSLAYSLRLVTVIGEG